MAFAPGVGVVTRQDSGERDRVPNPVPPCYAEAMKTKPIEIPEEIELHPDARERFERAVDKVMRSPPQPRKDPRKADEKPAKKD
jgi:hypothetical protein